MEQTSAANLEVIQQPGSAAAALSVLTPTAAQWFLDRFGTPTSAQRLAWPLVAAGGHLLLSSPTGTGKTLAVLLPLLGSSTPLPSVSPSHWAISTGIRGLIVAPLKALVNDMARTLAGHLEELAAWQVGTLTPVESAGPVVQHRGRRTDPGHDFLTGNVPLLRLAVRTGDTPPDERRLLRTDPPDILLTTPESLAILLTQPELSDIFRSLAWVLVDEVHALAGSKRGADLAVCLERLERLADGPVQRLGLSATATPLPTAARWLVGEGRRCSIASVPAAARWRLRIDPLMSGRGYVAGLVARLQPELGSRRSTLIFTNTRSLAERLSWALRRFLPDWDDQIAVHHSALSAGRRSDVEERFKKGQLRVVVSSTSLELGIDIGPIDLVVLVHPPGDVVRLLQRVGRAGHGPGRISEGLVLTATPAELLEAAVTAASGLADQCEPLVLPRCPLDVLCQQLAGLATAGEWSADDAYVLIRRSAPFCDLSRRDFDDCLAYLFGLDAAGQAWLPARLMGDAGGFRIRDRSTAKLVVRNLGTILAEPRHEVMLFTAEDSSEEMSQGQMIGTLDQPFAERLQPGDRILLDGRCLQVRDRSGSQVEVEQVIGRPVVPQWGSDGLPLSPELARRLYLLRIQAAEALREGPAALAALLRREYRLPDNAVSILSTYFELQEARSEIPDLETCLIEVVAGAHGDSCYIHTPLNRKGNDALARVAVRRLVRDHGRAARSEVADLGLILHLRGTVPANVTPPQLVRHLFDPRQFLADLDAALTDAGIVRERFAQVAVTGLMLLRNPSGSRRKVGGADWGQRRLYDQVTAHDADFVLLRQAAREVRADWCDAAAAFAYAQESTHLAIHSRNLSRISPFAEHWTQTVDGPAEEIDSPGDALRRLHAVLNGMGGGAA